jgi:hypothetical protein
MLARLQHLESLGLAREIRPGLWLPDIDLVAHLKALSIRTDIIALLHERQRGGAPSLSTVILNKEHPPTEPVIGRVYGRGAVDELSDQRYLLVEARDGQAYYVPLSDYSEAQGEEARIGAIVRITPTSKRSRGAADRNITSIAAQNGGIYDPERHGQIVEQRGRIPPGATVADYIAAHVKRAKALASRGLIEALADERFRIPTDLQQRIAEGPATARDSGRVLKVERLSANDLAHQVTTNGVTWLDQELHAGAALSGVARIGASRFEQDLAMALKDRAEHLQTLGLAQEIDGEIRLKTRFLDALYERELEDASLRLRSQYGEFTRLEPGLAIKGRVQAIETLPSGPHIVLASDSQFVLVPAKTGLGRSMTKPVELAVGRARTFNPREPMTYQLGIRYRELALGRSLRR